MTGKRPLWFRLGWTGLMFLASVALIFMVGVHPSNRDDTERTGRAVPTLTEEGDAPNAKIIDKDQRVDIETFDQKDSPLWPLVEELRSALPKKSSTTTNPMWQN